jgi:uncharacterized protein YutE (UPF0331/DUF86 family)
MVFKRESIEERLKKLAEIYRFFELHKELSYDGLVRDITVTLAVERASALAAEIIIDVLSHILASRHSLFPETYEETIEIAARQEVITDTLFKQLKGLGGYRNILIHEYIDLNYHEVYKNFRKLTDVIPYFQSEIIQYIEQNHS